MHSLFHNTGIMDDNKYSYYGEKTLAGFIITHILFMYLNPATYKYIFTIIKYTDDNGEIIKYDCIFPIEIGTYT